MRVAQCSTHMGGGLPDIAKLIKKHGVDVAHLTEMSAGGAAHVHQIASLMGSRYETHFLDKGGRSCENVLIIRKRRLWKTVKVKNTKLSEHIPNPKGLGNERWLLEVLRQHRLFGRKRSHMATHLNAGVMNFHAGTVQHNELTLANERSMAKILSRVAVRHFRDYQVTLQGDFNVTGGVKDWKYRPDLYLVKYLSGAACHAVDWILYNDKLANEHQLTVIKAGQDGNPSDHDFVIVDLTNNW